MTATGKVLLDTNIVIGLFAEEAPILAALGAVRTAYVPAIVLGELYYGAQRSGRTRENSARVDAFADAALVLPCDAATAAVYGDVKAGLRARGTPIPENDVWVAALARQHDLTLVTRDAHFGHVDGVQIIDWR